MVVKAGPTGWVIRCHGLVQGVGFRPYVWRLANQLGVSGWVENKGAAVEIWVFGTTQGLGEFRHRLLTELPLGAQVVSLELEPPDEPPPAGFAIRTSTTEAPAPFVLPDLAVCPACQAEIQDPKARRYRYPFTSCTQCGPRFSLIQRLPYDRERTSLAAFAPCPACLAEYRNPSDRRFHAQTIACPQCGPKVWVEPGGASGEAAIRQAVSWLRQGKILAVKGLSGFQLLADATCLQAVSRLRQRKRRPHKPLALMARDLEVVRCYCTLRLEEEQALASRVAPIVLLPANTYLPGVAPGLDLLSFVLPYTPLHCLLLAEFDTPLVFTSGNLSSDPLCADNAEAGERLAAVADGMVVHNCPIVHPCDDSLMRFAAGKMRVLRRARGLAPAPIPAPPGFEKVQGVLGLGGELKSSFALLAQGQIVLSQYLGDLETALGFARYQQELAGYLDLLEFTPRCLAVDMHPDYLATKLGRSMAKAQGLKLVAVQHHHAHFAAALAEYGHPRAGRAVLGLVLDGLGYGTDGTLWGGELLYGSYAGYRRLACLRPFPLLGGAKAVCEPWRNLVAQLSQAGMELTAFPALAGKPLEMIGKVLASGLWPWTSSCGRLFDAVAAARSGLSFRRGRRRFLAARPCTDVAGVVRRSGPRGC